MRKTGDVAQGAVIYHLVVKIYTHGKHGEHTEHALIAVARSVAVVDVPIECDAVLAVVRISEFGIDILCS